MLAAVSNKYKHKQYSKKIKLTLFRPKLSVPGQEAIGAPLFCVAQPHLTLGAVPRGGSTPLAPVVAPGASGPPVFCLSGWIGFRDGCREMSERERTHNSSTATSTFPAAVISYQLTCQLESKLLDVYRRCVHTITFV